MTIDTQLLHFLIIIIKLYTFPRQDFFFFFCGFHFSSPISQQVIYIFFFFRFVDFLFIPSPRVAVLFVVHFSLCFSFFFIYIRMTMEALLESPKKKEKKKRLI